MRRHRTANLRLFANHHTLQTPRILKPQAARHSCGTHLPPTPRTLIIQQRLERLTQPMQIVPNLVDGTLLGLGEVTLGVEGVLLEEEAHLVAAGQEVLVADVLGRGARGEARHGVVG